MAKKKGRPRKVGRPRTAHKKHKDIVKYVHLPDTAIAKDWLAYRFETSKRTILNAFRERGRPKKKKWYEKGYKP